MKHVVIAGGGFAGVRLARKLRKRTDISVTLINDSEEFRYSPSLYRAATGYKMGVARLSLEWILLDSPNVELVVGRVKSIDKKAKKIKLENGKRISYDYAVFALGSVTTYFDIKGLEKNAVGVKTSTEVIELRQHLHKMIAENSLVESNFVVVGAGPTGVEMAAALGDYLQRFALRYGNEHHNVSIWLVEAAPRVLPSMTEMTSDIALDRLNSLGVKVLVNTTVESESEKNLKTSAGTLKTQTVVWTAGTANNPFFKDQGKTFRINDRGKVKVSKKLEAIPNVYVIGDNAATEQSGLAYIAIQHANSVARDIKRRIDRKVRKEHKDKKPVQIIPIGNKWALLQYRQISMKGRLVALMRKAADFIGYGDVMGYIRALTIWTNADLEEDGAPIIQKNRTKAN